MRFKKNSVLFLVLLLIFSALPMAAVAANQGIRIQSYDQVKSLDSGVEDEIVVIYQDQGSLKDLGLTTSQIEAGKKINERVDIIKVTHPTKAEELVAEISNNPNVLAAEKNFNLKFSALPNDPFLADQYYFKSIGADKTWDQVSNESPILVAVLDSGITISHEDIDEQILAGYDYVDDKVNTTDAFGHGTSVAGCIAAIANNEMGIAGVSGSANIKIVPYRVGGKDEKDAKPSMGYIVAALYDAANRSDIRVINMSFGEYKESLILEKAVAYAASKGKILVAASGNEGDEAEAGQLSIPASYDHVISVGATDSNNQIAYFSQYNEEVDLCAPGVNTLTLKNDGGYYAPSGTSFSSPIVAGACAVLLAANPTLTPSEVESILKETAIDLSGQGRDDYFGYGLIQIDKALEQVDRKEALKITSFSSDQLPGQKIGTDIDLSAEASGGRGDYNYAFYYQLNGETTLIQDFSKNDTAVFTPSLPGIYKLKVAVKDENDAYADKMINNYVIKEANPLLTYRTHVQDRGWQPVVENGVISGTVGESLRLEAIELKAFDLDYDLGIEYQTHVQNRGWQDLVADGALSGTEGESLRLEAIKIGLTGTDAKRFDVYYQVHAQNQGWLDWAKNGQPAGTEGFGYRLEGIKVQILLKGSPPPGEMSQAYQKNN